MTNSTTGQKAAIGAIMFRLGIDKETKEEMILNYSDGRTRTSKELTYAEADHMIKTLNKLTNYEGSAESKMRNFILSMGHEMNW